VATYRSSVSFVIRLVAMTSETVKTLQRQVDDLTATIVKLQDRLAITDLVNAYSVIHDNACKRGASFQAQAGIEWQNLFTTDCIAEYPFGIHHGREGLAKWAFGYV
jgi:SnoaL-like domain